MERVRRPIVVLVVLVVSLAEADARSAQGWSPKPALAEERVVAAMVSETRMVETVRRLVGFGARMYGTPSNHASAAWLASAFREAGLQVQVREDTARDWYQPVSWEVRIEGPSGAGTVLESAWPSLGSPSAKGEGLLVLQPAKEGICLLPQDPPGGSRQPGASEAGGQSPMRPLVANPTPESVAGCLAVLFDGRASASGWPAVGRLRGRWTIPVFAIAPREAAPLRERLAAGERGPRDVRARRPIAPGPGAHVVATLPGKDHSKHILFCAHGDADSGGAVIPFARLTPAT